MHAILPVRKRSCSHSGCYCSPDKNLVRSGNLLGKRVLESATILLSIFVLFQQGYMSQSGLWGAAPEDVHVD